MRQTAQPFTEYSLDLVLVQRIGNPLHPGRVITGKDAIVQCFKGNATPLELALEPFMAVDAHLYRVRKVRAELDKQRTEVPVVQIEVVLIDHGRRTIQPGVARTFLTASSLGAKNAGLLLRLANEQHAFLILELRQVSLGDV